MALPTPPSTGLVDLRDCKRYFARLPANSPMRIAIQGEPDFIPASAYASKFEVWLRLIYS